MKGKLIVLYGINNIGKSTQALKLVDRFEREGFQSEYVKYPVYDENPSGPFINDVLRKGKDVSVEELQMWYTVNRFQFESKLKKMLEEGVHVIAEDYIGTGIAWGMAQGIEKQWLVEMNRFLVSEDISVYMFGERFMDGVEKNHRNEQDDELMQKAAQAHEELSRDFDWPRVDASQSIDEVHDQIWNIVKGNIEV